jgi:hypothetical protein
MSKRPSATPARKNTKRLKPSVESTVFSLHDVAGITQHFDVFGYVVVRVLDEAGCQKAIAEQLRQILLKQPWEEKLEVRDRVTGEVLDINCDEARYVKELTTPCIPKAALEHYDRVAPLHKKFGACCDPSAFHLRTVWRIRQAEPLYAIARGLLKESKIYTTIDRPIQKMPGMGDEEFLHWDFHILDTDSRDDTLPMLCGKVSFTDSTFVCVPGTHTLEFALEFRSLYEDLYPNAKITAPKFGLDPKKEDPLELREARQSIGVPAGCAVFWSPCLLHGTEKSPKDSGISFGSYIGYMRDIDRSKYKDERQDRINSYLQGKAPARYYSLDPTHYYPARYDNFPHMLEPYVNKTPLDYVGRSERVIQSGPNKGKSVPVLVPVPDPDYVPFPLSPLGYRLLGSEPW